MKRAAIPVAVIVLAMSVAAAGWLGFTGAGGLPGAGSQPTPHPPAKTVPVTRGDVRQVLVVPGEVVPMVRQDLSFPVGGRLTGPVVHPGDRVTQGQTLARLETEQLEQAVALAQVDLEVKQAALERIKAGPSAAELVTARAEAAAAQLRLDTLRDGTSPADLAAQAAVSGAAAELENAQHNLVVVQKSDVVSKNVRDREYEHAWYEANYGEYLKKYQQGEVDKTRLDLEWNALMTAKERLDSARAQAALALGEANSRVARAEEDLRQAQARLAELTAGPSPEEVEAAELEVHRAQIRLEQLIAGPDATELTPVQAAVRAAEIALAKAQADLAAATLAAPFNGTVLAVKARPGEQVMANTPIIVLADLARLEVRATVGQEDVGLVQPAQPATLSFDARPGQSFPGRVTRVVPEGAEGQGVVTYEVFIALDQTPPGLLPDMTTDAEIVVAERGDVLTLPCRTIRARPNTTVSVPVLDGGQVVTRRVEIGLVGDLNAEILAGLREGDQVVVEG
ncbi:MAG: efflux RND transporter periplasmic adaptor subunit [Ardenticatenaceae bacterium]|nr:efflux RND transporter periplasmic adaptor subunit [Ardenticatenaceae bacterium]